VHLKSTSRPVNIRIRTFQAEVGEEKREHKKIDRNVFFVPPFVGSLSVVTVVIGEIDLC